jgi:hypothetical protein
MPALPPTLLLLLLLVMWVGPGALPLLLAALLQVAGRPLLAARRQG